MLIRALGNNAVVHFFLFFETKRQVTSGIPVRSDRVRHDEELERRSHPREGFRRRGKEGYAQISVINEVAKVLNIISAVIL